MWCPILLFDGSSSHASDRCYGARKRTPPEVTSLLRLMRDRLTLMRDVARSKWNANRPVGDPKREQSLLQEMDE
jgi:Chorismate mutase type II